MLGSIIRMLDEQMMLNYDDTVVQESEIKQQHAISLSSNFDHPVAGCQTISSLKMTKYKKEVVAQCLYCQAQLV